MPDNRAVWSILCFGFTLIIDKDHAYGTDLVKVTLKIAKNRLFAIFRLFVASFGTIIYTSRRF